MHRHRDGEVVKSIFTTTHTDTHTHSPAVAMEAIPSIPQTNKLHRCRIVAHRHRLSGPKRSESAACLFDEEKEHD